MILLNLSDFEGFIMKILTMHLAHECIQKLSCGVGLI